MWIIACWRNSFNLKQCMHYDYEKDKIFDLKHKVELISNMITTRITHQITELQNVEHLEVTSGLKPFKF